MFGKGGGQFCYFVFFVEKSQFLQEWGSVVWIFTALFSSYHEGQVKINKISESKIVKLLIFSYPSFFSYALWAQKNRLGSFEYPQHMFWLRNKVFLHALNLRPGSPYWDQPLITLPTSNSQIYLVLCGNDISRLYYLNYSRDQARGYETLHAQLNWVRNFNCW